jgi:hypothetical protein
MTARSLVKIPDYASGEPRAVANLRRTCVSLRQHPKRVLNTLP